MRTASNSLGSLAQKERIIMTMVLMSLAVVAIMIAQAVNIMNKLHAENK